MYESWFEHVWPWIKVSDVLSRKKIVVQRMNSIMHYLETKAVVYNKSTDIVECKSGLDSRLAFTNTATKQIDLCPLIFNEHAIHAVYWDSMEYMRAFVVVHEMYHVAIDTNGGDGKSDKAYLRAYCRALAHFDPGAAISNANNYAYYVMGSYWNRREKPPEEQHDYGFWNHHAPDEKWGTMSTDGAVASIKYDNTIVMFIYRDDRSPKAAGRLYYRLAELVNGHPMLREPVIVREEKHDLQPEEVLSITRPSLSAHSLYFYCAYVDKNSRRVTVLESTLRSVVGNIQYIFTWKNLEVGAFAPPLIDEKSNNNPAVSFLAYRVPIVFKPAGLYCVYVNDKKSLTCVAKLDWKDAIWQEVPFPAALKLPATVLTPALVIFDNILRCGYLGMGFLNLLTYTDTTRAGDFGVWVRDTHAPLKMDVTAFALGEIKTPSGPVLVAVGVNDVLGDYYVYYAVYHTTTGWDKPNRLSTLTSSGAPMLTHIDSRLSMFIRDLHGTIDRRGT